MRRPFVFVTFAIIFGFYATAGLLGALVAARAQPALAAALGGVAAAAGAATVGLWRERAWAPPAVLVAGAAGAAFAVGLLALVPAPQVAEARGAAVAGALLWAAFCALAAWLVRRRLAPAA
jgi:hypothetical protein